MDPLFLHKIIHILAFVDNHSFTLGNKRYPHNGIQNAGEQQRSSPLFPILQHLAHNKQNKERKSLKVKPWAVLVSTDLVIEKISDNECDKDVVLRLNEPLNRRSDFSPQKYKIQDQQTW